MMNMSLLAGTNKGRIIILESETLQVMKELVVSEERNCQIRSMSVSNSGKVRDLCVCNCI